MKPLEKFIRYLVSAFVVAGVASAVFLILFSSFGSFSGKSLSAVPEYHGKGFLSESPLEDTMRKTAAPVETSSSGRDARVSFNQPVSQNAFNPRKIIKNASFSFLVARAADASAAIESLAASFGGFVADERIYEISNGVNAGTVTVRIPADKFDAVRTELKKLALKIEDETVQTQDATEQVTDLESRLRNLHMEEQQYVDIMKRAKTIEDTLQVAARLSDVRGRIEYMQGQLQYLSRQIDMSAITIALTEENDIEVWGIRWRPLYIVKQSFHAMLASLAAYVDAMIALLFYLPALILWGGTGALAIFILMRIGYWARVKFFSRQARPSRRKAHAGVAAKP